MSEPPAQGAGLRGARCPHSLRPAVTGLCAAALTAILGTNNAITKQTNKNQKKRKKNPSVLSKGQTP